MKKSLALLIIPFLIGCGNSKKEAPAPGTQPFFEFDKVEHYHLSIPKAEYDSILYNPNKSRLEAGLLQILRERIPVSGIDTLFIKNMEILQFQKQEIPTSEHGSLKAIFSVKDAIDAPKQACESVFRDVLIFRQKGKFIGVAKLSFDCETSYIMGSRYNPDSFGTASDFDQLKKLLEQP